MNVRFRERASTLVAAGCVAALLATTAAPPALAGPPARTSHQSYLLANAGTHPRDLGLPLGPLSWALTAGDGLIRLTIRDDTDPHLPGTPTGLYAFHDAAGRSVGSGIFCRRSAQLAIPSAARSVVLRIGQLDGACGLGLEGAKGTVTAEIWARR